MTCLAHAAHAAPHYDLCLTRNAHTPHAPYTFTSLQWAAAGSAWVVASIGGANVLTLFLDRYCLAGTCVSYSSAAGGALAFGTGPLAIAGMALLSIAGIFAVCSMPLTLLKLRPQGLPAAGAARVTLSAVGLVFGILGVILVRSAHLQPHFFRTLRAPPGAHSPRSLDSLHTHTPLHWAAAGLLWGPASGLCVRPRAGPLHCGCPALHCAPGALLQGALRLLRRAPSGPHPAPGLCAHWPHCSGHAQPAARASARASASRPAPRLDQVRP